MAKTLKVAVLIGSLRREAISRKLANALKELAPPQLQLDIIEIGDLPLYNEDLEGKDITPPAAWTAFRKQLAASDAVLFVTPEYNRSVPGCLKNAIDVGSRPYGESAWDGKPGGIVSHSSGAISGFGANHHLRQSLVFLNVPAMQQPEAYISRSPSLFDEKTGKLNNDSTRGFLKQYLDAFAAWAERNIVR